MTTVAPPLHNEGGTQPVPASASARKSRRRVKVRDTDYAEEAEDFFYGEGR
jgi:hypothetical protein